MLLRCVVSVRLCCFRIVLWCVVGLVCWALCVVGVLLRVVRVVCCVCCVFLFSFLLGCLVCWGWSGFLWWLLLRVFCSCCVGWLCCVAPGALLVGLRCCVALSGFLLLVVFWWFLVVVGPPPLFCCWWCFCSWLILVMLLLRFLSKKPPFLGGCVVLLRAAIGVRLGVLSCSLRRLRTRLFCLVCVWFGFLLLLVFRLVLVSLVLCVLSVLPRLFRGFVSSLARFSCFVLFSSLRLVVWRVLLCVCFFRSVSLLLLVMIWSFGGFCVCWSAVRWLASSSCLP